MNYLYLAAHDVACIIAISVMVLTNHPWWTIAFIVPLFCTTVIQQKA